MAGTTGTDALSSWRPVIGIAWVAMTVFLVVLPDIIRWWRTSVTACWLRGRLGSVRATVASPFRLLRKRHTKTTAGAGASPTPAPVVPGHIEVTRGE